MEDNDIIDLFGVRDERAISESETKYGRYCTSIALRILGNSSDSEECVNDTWLAAWNAIPPARPSCLRVFLGKITRNIALSRHRDAFAAKRGGGIRPVSFDELDECIPSDKEIDEHLRIEELTNHLNNFLEGLPLADRRIFVRRYWYCDQIDSIAKLYGLKEGAVKMKLKRMRDRLKDRLLKEDVYV